MPTTNPVAEWIPDHVGTDELGSPVRNGGPSRAAFDSSTGGAVHGCGSPVVSARPESLGTASGLARILAALMRQAYVGPRDRERAGANADVCSRRSACSPSCDQSIRGLAFS